MAGVLKQGVLKHELLLEHLVCMATLSLCMPGRWWSVEVTSSCTRSHAAAAQASARARCPPGLDMSVSILTSGYWPSYPVLEAKLPEELTQHQAVFKARLHASSVFTCMHPLCSSEAGCCLLGDGLQPG